MVRLDEGFSAHILEEKSGAPRPDYEPGNPAMSGGIKCRH